MTKEYKIWREGFVGIEEHQTAQLIGQVEAETFDEAIKKYEEMNPLFIITKQGEHYTMFGDRLFDNEIDARKSFG